MERGVVLGVRGEGEWGRRKVGEERTMHRDKAENRERGAEREKVKRNTEKSERERNEEKGESEKRKERKEEKKGERRE